MIVKCTPIMPAAEHIKVAFNINIFDICILKKEKKYRESEVGKPYWIRADETPTIVSS